MARIRSAVPQPAEAAPRPAAAPAKKRAPAKAARTQAARAAKPAPAKAVKAKPAARTATKTTAKVAKPAKPAAASKPSKQAKAPKAPKPKLVRDSFTIPKNEYQALDGLKARALGLGRQARKSELLRAGIQALAAMADAAFRAALEAVPALKTGRPKAGD